MKTAELKIDGMTCGHCVMSVKKELMKVPHLQVEDIQIGTARVAYDESQVSQDDLQTAIKEAGYTLNI